MKKTVIFILTTLFLLGVSGCMENKNYNELAESIGKITNDSTEKSIEDVTSAMSLKYGCAFEATKIGGRIDSDSTTFYLVPDFDKELTVRAQLDFETGDVLDNLIDRLVGKSFSGKLDNGLKAEDVECVSRSTFFCKERDKEEDDIYITAEEYCEKYEPSEVLVYIVLKKGGIDDSTARKLIDALIEANRRYGTDIALYGVILSDSDYSVCADTIQDEPVLNSTWFGTNFKPLDSFRFAVADGKSNLSVSDLSEILSGE